MRHLRRPWIYSSGCCRTSTAPALAWPTADPDRGRGQRGRWSGSGADRHLLTHVGGDAIELRCELVVVEQQRVQIRAPSHRVLRDERSLDHLVLGRTEE